jgi:hypothetical protein
MPIQYVGGQTSGRAGATSTSSVNFALTGGIDTVPRDGDLVIISCAVGSQGRNAAQAISGYTALTQLNPNSTTQDTSLCVSYKRMGPTPDTSFTLPSTGNNQDAQAYTVQVFRGVNYYTPMDVTPITATGTGTTRADPGAITPQAAGAFIVVCSAGCAAATSNFTYSALSGVLTFSQADTNDVVVGSGYYDAWSSGAYDPAASSTGSANAADSWAAYTLALRPSPAIDTIVDDFDGASVDTNIWWLADSTSGCTPTIVADALDLNITAAVTNNRSLAYSTSIFSLIGSSVYVKLVRPCRTSGDAAGIATQLMLEQDAPAGRGDRLYFTISSNGTFEVVKQDNFVPTQLALITSDYFSNAATHKCLRIREASGTVYFDTAPESSSNPPASGDWVNRHSVALSSLPARFDAVTVFLWTLMYDAAGGVPTQSAQFDGLNTAASVIAPSGSLAATETGSDTASFAGNVKVTGTLATSESGSDTFAGTGNALPAIVGTLAATETGSDTFAGVIDNRDVVGSLAATEPATDTFAGSGTTGNAGAMAASESGADTFAGNGAVQVTGALAASEAGSDGFAGAGIVKVTGTLAPTETGADTFVATGTLSHSGTLAAQETTNDVFAGAGVVKITGSLAATETGQDDYTGQGTAGGVTANLAVTETGSDVFASTGSIPVTGTMVLAEAGADAFAGSGKLPIQGSLASVESGIDQFLASSYVAVVGSFAATELGPDVLFVPGFVRIIGAMAANEASIAIPANPGIDFASFSGVVPVVGSLAAVEPQADIFSADGKSIIYSTLNAVEAGVDIFSASGYVFSQYPLAGLEQLYPLTGLKQSYPLE